MACVRRSPSPEGGKYGGSARQPSDSLSCDLGHVAIGETRPRFCIPHCADWARMSRQLKQALHDKEHAGPCDYNAIDECSLTLLGTASVDGLQCKVLVRLMR